MNERHVRIPEYSAILGILVRTPAGQEIRSNSQRFFPAATFELDLQDALSGVLPGRLLDEAALREIRLVAQIMGSGAKRYNSDVFHKAVEHGVTVILRNKYRPQGSGN